MNETVGRLIADLLRLPWTELGAPHYLDEYTSSQWLSVTALRSLQMAKLRRLVWHCILEVPSLRTSISAALTPSQIEKLDDITRLPLGSSNGAHTQADRRELDARRAALRTRSQSWGAPEDKWWTIPSRGVLAAPCAESGEAMHVHADHAIVESVEGRLLLTDLHDFTDPLLRGDLGVSGRVLSTPCPCGRMLPLIQLT